MQPNKHRCMLQLEGLLVPLPCRQADQSLLLLLRLLLQPRAPPTAAMLLWSCGPY
jgi:hypothetical protein